MMSIIYAAAPALRGALVTLLCWCLAGAALAVIETYEFDNEQLRERYNTFTEVLRCPKCQNQNLSGSNSPIAADLRRELHRLLQEGYSDEQIRDYMVARYGEFILYEPPLNRHTLVLWLFPLLLLLAGMGAWALVVRQRRTQLPDTDNHDDQMRAQAAAIRDRYQSPDQPAPVNKETR